MPKSLNSKILIVFVLISLLSIEKASAKTEVFLSSKHKIKETLITTLNSSQKSIDIAAFVFTSGDIAEALLMAKKRGVKIRIILDSKQENSSHPVSNFLKEEDFDLQFVKGNIGGFMHNTFVVCDNSYVITGSYNWTDHSDKFNYENIVLIDDKDIIQQFLNEFNLMSSNSLLTTNITNQIKTLETSVAPTKDIAVKKEDDEKDAITTKEIQQKNSKNDKPLNDLNNNFLDITFDGFDELFGDNSKMSKAKKKQLWKNKFKNKYVKWKGKIHYKGVSLYDWNKVGISHKNKEADVVIKFDFNQRPLVQSINIGDIITYRGQLVSLRGIGSPYKIEDCKVIKKE